MKAYIMNKNLKNENWTTLAKKNNVDYRTIKKYAKLTKEEFKYKRTKILKKRNNKKLIQLISSIMNTNHELKASGVHLRLEEEGIKISERQVRRYVARWKQKNKECNIPIRMNKEPGEEFQNDWKENMKLKTFDNKIIRFNVWGSVSSFTNKVSFILTKDKKRDTVLHCLAKSFEKFGGVPMKLKFDNMKTIIDTHKNGEINKVINSKILQFGNDYGTKIETSEPYNPQSKGIIEAKMKLLDQLKAFDEKIKSWDHLKQLVKKIETKNNLRFDLFEPLKEVPCKKIHNIYLAGVTTKKVGSDGMILFNEKRYSVGKEYVDYDTLIKVLEGNKINIYSDKGKYIVTHEISESKYNYNYHHFYGIITQTKYLKYNNHKSIDEFVVKQFAKLGGKYSD